MTTIDFNIRIDESLREEAAQIFAGYGLTPALAIQLFLNQVVATRKVPLSFEYQAELKPTAKLLGAIEELEQADLPTYGSIDALLGAMHEKI